MKPMRWKGNRFRLLIWGEILFAAVCCGAVVIGQIYEIKDFLRSFEAIAYVAFSLLGISFGSTVVLAMAYVITGMRRIKNNHCQHCDYPLHGLSKNPNHPCPECGTPRGENWLDME